VSGRSGTATCAQGADPSSIKRGRRLPYFLLLIALLLAAAIVKNNGSAIVSTAVLRSHTQWAQLYAALPLSFEENRGQTDPRVNFVSRGQGYALFLTGGEAVLTLKNATSSSKGQKTAVSATALRMRLLGADAHVLATGRDELPGKANYFLGNNPSKWRTNIPTYAKVRYASVYPGIDLVYYGTRGGELEYDFVVRPGADPKAISLGIETQRRAPLRINAQGDLVVALPNGSVQFHKPVVYQPDSVEAITSFASLAPNSHASQVEGHYALDAQNRVSFELGPYDHRRPLVIDPVLIYATYLGGSGGDIGYGITVDSTLDAYIAGVTNSSDFPLDTTPGSSTLQASTKGNGDCFIAKLNSAGTKLLYSTYLGGTQTDTATAIAQSAGEVYITGYTNSADFPIKAPAGVGTTNPFQVNYGGSTDAFVSHIDATGGVLVYSSFLGGSGLDAGFGIAVDSTGNAYVTGTTQSTNFPTASPLQANNAGSQDAFVSKVNLTGEQLLYSTYLGGTQVDVAQSIQLDSSNNAYIAGYTFSPDFPHPSAEQGTIGGGADAFVAELNAAGSALTFSTFLGGSGDDRAYGLALDSSKNIYVTGATGSTDFPVTSGVLQSSLKGAGDAFVTKFNNTGASLVYSTYLGGTGIDQGNAIAVTQAGLAFVTGSTASSDFPTQNPIQGVLGLSNNQLCGTAPCSDAFVSQFNAAGTALTYSTYLGGNGPDFGQGIALDGSGDPYITGSTSSTNFPAIWGGSLKSTLTGTAGNAFVAKIDSANEPNAAILPSTLNFGNETLATTSGLQQIVIVNPGTAPLVITNIQVALVALSATVFQITDNPNPCLGTIAPNGGYCTMNVSFTPNSVSPVSSQITVTDNVGGVAGSEQTINLTGTGVTAATAVTVQPTSLSFASQSVGTVSAPQNVTITNTGTQTLSISGIAVGNSDFSETNTCGALQNSLAVGQSCTVSVTFNPAASGNRASSLNISDNATGSPQSVILSGIGAAAFTITSPKANNPVIIGSTQTTYTIVAEGPTSFNGAISLACSAGTTCSFSPNPIFVGGTSTLTISNLTTNLPNPYPFTVTGTSGSQSTTANFSLGFEDFTLTATPSVVTIQAGTPASYNVLVNPLNGFNQQVQLSCFSGMPQDATCTWTPNSAPTPNGTTPSTVNLSISTVKFIPTSTHVVPRFPGGKLPPILFGLLSLAGLVSLTFGNRRRARHGQFGSVWMGVRLAALSLILALNLAMVACRASTLAISGTTTGNYTITIQGTLEANTAVVRYATLNLSVTASAP
jgi:hypothetical protein